MILVDSSIWIDHFRSTNRHLTDLLDQRGALMHPFVLGELVARHLPSRDSTITDLRKLPQSIFVSNDEVHYLIERRKLFGLGVGFLDMHLLASALTQNTKLWTRDRRLNKAASDLFLAYSPPQANQP